MKRDKLNRYKSSKQNVEDYEKLLNQYAKEKKAERAARLAEAEAAKAEKK